MITRLRIQGMLSRHAVQAVFTALGGVDGVVRAHVTLGEAVVEHDARATPETLRAAVTLAGFEVTESTEERRQLPLL